MMGFQRMRGNRYLSRTVPRGKRYLSRTVPRGKRYLSRTVPRSFGGFANECLLGRNFSWHHFLLLR